MRPIDADALIEGIYELRKSPWYNGENGNYKWLIRSETIGIVVDLCIKDAPTLDYAPVKHGEWNEVEGYDGDCHYQCALCGEEWVLNDGTPLENNMHYCPRCGARMDGKEDRK